MNKIVKKILATACLISTAFSVVACGGGSDFGGSYEGELELGFWAELAQTTAGANGSGGLGGDDSTDAVINGDPTKAVAYDGSKVTITFYHTMGQMLQEVLTKKKKRVIIKPQSTKEEMFLWLRRGA